MDFSGSTNSFTPNVDARFVTSCTNVSVGVVALVRMKDERSGNTESPVSGVSTHQLVIREKWTGGAGKMVDRSVVPKKQSNARQYDTEIVNYVDDFLCCR